MALIRPIPESAAGTLAGTEITVTNNNTINSATVGDYYIVTCLVNAYPATVTGATVVASHGSSFTNPTSMLLLATDTTITANGNPWSAVALHVTVS